MEFRSQNDSIIELNKLAENHRQSVLIEGPLGCGKTYLAKQYSNMLNISDFIEVSPKVADIRQAIESCIVNTNNMVLCIENLDLGVKSASYTLLKFLEEPYPNVYIIVTCRSIDSIPDTIISRSAVVTVTPPTSFDLSDYAETKDFSKFHMLESRLVWKCCRTLSDVDNVLAMSIDQIQYYENLSNVCKCNDSVSNLVWSMSHYDSNQECNLELAIRSISYLMNSPFATNCGIECIKDLNQGRISKHAILSKFVMNIKYCE